MANSLDHDTLFPLLEALTIPSGYKDYNNALPDETAVLDEWSKRSVSVLNQVKVQLEKVDVKECPVDDLARIVVSVSPFSFDVSSLSESSEYFPYEEERNVLNGEAPWVTSNAKAISGDILSRMNATHGATLAKHILEHVVKPVFRASNPHPHVDSITGRSLPSSRIAKPPQQGGLSSVTQDFFDSEGQRWKGNLGLPAIIYWCIDNTSADGYQGAWHLAVPPLMTLLDDYEPRYKLWGLLIAQRMLKSTPPSLLQRTGIDGLLKTSFRKVVAHQDSPLSPTILHLSLSQSLRLFLLTTPEGSKARFDALSDLLGQGIINEVWTYTFDKPEIVRCTLNALPPLIRSLDIGCTRFLQGLMPQLVQPLVNYPSNHAGLPVDLLQLQMQVASLKVVIPLIRVCAPRIHGWRLTILDALVRCWVSMIADRAKDVYTLSFPWRLPAHQVDSDDEEEADVPPMASVGRVEIPIDIQSVRPSDPSDIPSNSACLTELLQVATYALAQACPSLTKVEFPLLLQKEPTLLKGLIPHQQQL